MRLKQNVTLQRNSIKNDYICTETNYVINHGSKNHILANKRKAYQHIVSDINERWPSLNHAICSRQNKTSLFFVLHNTRRAQMTRQYLQWVFWFVRYFIKRNKIRLISCRNLMCFFGEYRRHTLVRILFLRDRGRNPERGEKNRRTGPRTFSIVVFYVILSHKKLYLHFDDGAANRQHTKHNTVRNHVDRSRRRPCRCARNCTIRSASLSVRVYRPNVIERAGA